MGTRKVIQGREAAVRVSHYDRFMCVGKLRDVVHKTRFRIIPPRGQDSRHLNPVPKVAEACC